MSTARTAESFHDAQDALVAKIEAQDGWDIVVGDAFVRGMRDIGYKSTSFALAELIDNSVQANASRVDMVFGFDDGKKPTSLAVIDDGHGMTPKMVRASLIWGAGTRAENRGGFGKYGYGLPSASISQCLRVVVYSKLKGGAWYRSYLDVDEIKDGDPRWIKGNRIAMPPEVEEEPPKFVIDFLAKAGRWDSFEHGTVIVWDKLDPKRIDYKRREELRNKLVTDLGVIYRNFLIKTPMSVDGVRIEPCDPLFVTEGFRYYDIDEDRAVELPSAPVEVKDKATGEVIGTMRVRYSRMPATFFRKPEYKKTNRPGRKDAFNERLAIRDANNGIIFLRNSRQIDVVRPPRWLMFLNATTDRFWSVEVDFDASLDDFFSITTSKQQITPDDSIWNMLNDKAKLVANIAQMRHDYQKEAKLIASEAEQAKAEGEQRASVEAWKNSEKFRTSTKPEPTPEREQEASDNLDQEAKRRAAKAGLKPEVVERELVAERQDEEYFVETEDMPGAPFFRCVQEGGARILYLNVAHPFYVELYAGPGASARLRAGLEVLLWTLGNSEVDAEPGSDRRLFYEGERSSVWSPRLATALSVLKNIKVIEADEESDTAA